MQTIWGFDLGTASIGFTVVRHDPERQAGELVWLGTRIFPEARDKGEKWAPRNLPRRQARLARRQGRRRRWRRVHLRRLLAENQLLPSPQATPPNHQDPYALRAKGLHEPLAPEELGWAIFHLLKRRGFQGSRKHDTTERRDPKKQRDEEESRKRSADLERKLDGRPLATYLATIETTNELPQRRRNVGQTRPMVTDELARLWRTQQPHHPAILTDALWKSIDEVALRQRPTYFRQRTVGMCDLELKEPRALKADWLTQQVEMLQLVNALRLEGGNQRGLDEAERAKAIDYLSTEQRPTWAGLRRAVSLPRTAKFTHERGEKTTIRGNRTEAALRTILGADFPAHPMAQPIRDAIGTAWHLLEYRPARHGSIWEIRAFAEIEAERARLAAHAVAVWRLSPELAASLSRIDLAHGHGRHSIKAMRALLPALERGEPYMTALQAAYPPRPSGTPAARLPGPNAGELHKLNDPFLKQEMTRLIGAVRNPSVLRTLGELQKIGNALLREFGRPDLIRIELARELRQSGEERRDADRDQSTREKRRDDARKELTRLGKPAEGRAGDENVQRLLLWHEQGGRCPYSGEMIGCADALSAHATEIDHIFPRSRSFDNSQGNKVLCLTHLNRAKGRQTPHEWLHADADRWTQLAGTVWPAMKQSGWPEAKWRRCTKPFLEEGFSERQLVDTGYIARLARDYLGLLFGGGQAGIDAVQPVPGRATAQLRRAWGIGLGALLHGDENAPKVRDDHRHHAVDALAVALTDPGAVATLSRWWQQRELTHTKPRFPPPWPDFRNEAKNWIERMVVSHRVLTKLTGALHKDGRFGDTGEITDGYTLYVKRKPVSELTPGDIACIRDPAAKQSIVAAIAAAGSAKTALAGEIRLPRANGSPGPVIRRVRLLVKRKDGVMRTHATRNIHAELGPGTNDHIAIFEDGGTVLGRVTTKRETLRSQRMPDQRANHANGGRLVMKLRPGDILYRAVENRSEYVLVRKFFGSGQIFIKPITMALVPKPELSMTPRPLLQQGWRKVAVDPIGRVTPAK